MAESLLQQVRALIDTPELPALGPGPRPGVQSVAALHARLDAVAAGVDVKPSELSLIRALVLLWHDHLDASHRLSQEIGSTDGSYVHGIMHRREPDYGNSKYWFRKVGSHRCFPAVAERVAALLGEHALADSLLNGGEWDPFAFIDACELREGQNNEDATLLRRIQGVEFEVLLEEFTL